MKRWMTAVAMIVALGGGVAVADLCERCEQMMFDASMGRCTQCGGATPSGAFKLCDPCSDKAGQCQVCQQPLAKAPATRPATRPSED